MSDQNSTGGYGSQDPYSAPSGDPWSSGSTNQDSGQQWSSGTVDGGSAGDVGTSGGYGSSWSDGSGGQVSGWSGGAGSAGPAQYVDPYGSQLPVDPTASAHEAPQFGQGALPYGGPPQPVYVPAAPTNALAVTAMILGIVSITCMPLASPVGLVLAILGMKQTSTSGEQGKGMAIAGLVLSILGLLVLIGWVLYFVFVVVLVASDPSSY